MRSSQETAPDEVIAEESQKRQKVEENTQEEFTQEMINAQRLSIENAKNVSLFLC